MKHYFTAHLIQSKSQGNLYTGKLYGNYPNIKVDLIENDKYVKTVKLSTMQRNYKIIEHSILSAKELNK